MARAEMASIEMAGTGAGSNAAWGRLPKKVELHEEYAMLWELVAELVAKSVAKQTARVGCRVLKSNPASQSR